MISQVKPPNASARHAHRIVHADRPLLQPPVAREERRASLWPAALMLLLAALVGIVAFSVASPADTRTSDEHLPPMSGPFHP